MKVGIITVQKAPENFGACLQCYALWKFVENQGHECEVIDLVRPWSPEYIESKYFSEKKRRKRAALPKRILGRIINLLFSKKNVIPSENDHFRAFNNQIKYSQTYFSVDSLYDTPPIYDLYISGSDQIWNPLMPFINEPYFLTFVPKGKKKISYASSFALEEIPEGIWPPKVDWLGDFHAISVREKSGVKIVKSVFNREATLVVDPTMLLTRDEWESILVQPDKNKNYLLLYTLQYNPIIVRKVRELAIKNDLSIRVVISSTTGDKPENDSVIEYITTAGPKEWLGLIHDADIVITDSFHGSVFSLLFSKRFLTICTNKRVSERMTTLFDNLSLTNNYMDVEQFLKLENLDCANYLFDNVATAIMKQREKSVAFLINALN